MSKASNLAGFVPSITPVNDLSVGVLTATSFSGNATGLSGTPNITVGFITATGASISGNVDVGGNVSIAGTLTYEDVTNVDSIGIVTARAGIVLGPTANTIQLGTGTTISSPSSNTFTVLTNGSERVRVDSSGRLGVGTNNPSAALHVVTSGAGQIRYFDGAVTGSFGSFGSGNEVFLGSGKSLSFTTNGITSSETRMTIDTSGRVGIGTLIPTNGLLNVVSLTSGAIAINVNCRSNNDYAFIRFSDYSGSEPLGYVGIQRTGVNSGILLFEVSGTERARISSAGGFSVGTTADPGVGAIYATGDITAFYSSDIRLKKDIEPISEPIKKLMEISGVTYKWNEEYLKDKDVDGYFVRETEVGVIAQEVEKVLPEVVATRENGYKAVRYEKLVALLIEAVKDQQKQIDELKARLEEV